MRFDFVGDLKVLGPVTAPFDGEGRLACFTGADAVFGNLEVPHTGTGYPQEKNKVYRAPVSAVETVRDLGFSAVSLANNHMMDYGIEGLSETIRELRRVGLPFAGAGEDSAAAFAPAIIDAPGGRIALLSFSSTVPTGANATAERPGIAAVRVQQSFEVDPVLLEEQPGTPPLVRTSVRETDAQRLVCAVAAARDVADVVVVAAHWGLPVPFSPANQGPLAQYQRPLAHRLADAGADVVFGHHPHSLMGVERRGRSVILYSAGNFVFHESPSAPSSADHPRAGYQPLPRTSAWYDTAVFSVGIDGDRRTLRIATQRMNAEGDPQPVTANDDTGLQRVLEHTRTFHPDVTVDRDGTFRFGRDAA